MHAEIKEGVEGEECVLVGKQATEHNKIRYCSYTVVKLALNNNNSHQLIMSIHHNHTL